MSPARSPTAKPPSKPQRGRDREFVQGLQRGFAVIKAFGDGASPLGVSDVARRTGLTRAVARRYLLTLQRLGYIAQDGSNYSLTPRILELGFAFLSSLSLAQVAKPFLAEVVEKFQESCSVSVLDGTDVFYVARVTANRIMTTNLTVGSRMPAHATAMGKVLLASLPPDALNTCLRETRLTQLTDRTIATERRLREELAVVRRRGFASNDQESEMGVRTVAVPICDRTGRVVAAMNLAAHASRVSMRDLRLRHLPALQRAARAIGDAIGSTTRMS